MIHEEIVTFEVAKLAKEKGFPQDPDKNDHCEMYCWDGLRNIHPLGAWIVWEMEEFSHDNLYAAPTQSLLQRWLREEKKIDISIRPVFTFGPLEYSIDVFNDYIPVKLGSNSNYEKALEIALKYVLEEML